MERDLSQNDLLPYMYQGPLPTAKKQNVVSFNNKILLVYFYNSISK